MTFPFANIPVGTAVHQFDQLYEAKVVSRPNRFIVIAEISGTIQKCHLHDPGRLKELIFPGNLILVRDSTRTKTSYRVTAARGNGSWKLVDSGIHSDIAGNFLSHGYLKEVALGDRRLDFAWKTEKGTVYLEVKGCSLISGQKAVFPDAPTLRGTAQVELLSEYLVHGGTAYILVLVFSPEAECFATNHETDPGFSHAFSGFLDAGGQVKIVKIGFHGNSLEYLGAIPFCG